MRGGVDVRSTPRRSRPAAWGSSYSTTAPLDDDKAGDGGKDMEINVRAEYVQWSNKRGGQGTVRRIRLEVFVPCEELVNGALEGSIRSEAQVRQDGSNRRMPRRIDLFLDPSCAAHTSSSASLLRVTAREMKHTHSQPSPSRVSLHKPHQCSTGERGVQFANCAEELGTTSSWASF